MKGMGNYTHHSLVYASVYERCKRARAGWYATLVVALTYAAVTIPMVIAKADWTLWTFVIPIVISTLFGLLAYGFYRQLVRAQQQLDSLTEMFGIGRLWDDA